MLADGKVALTAFLPTDRAFRKLASDLTGKRYTSESAVFADVASLGIDTVEAVLLYHVVPGRNGDLPPGAALRRGGPHHGLGWHGDGGRASAGASSSCRMPTPTTATRRSSGPDINKGNLQIAHGISEVLRPLDL